MTRLREHEAGVRGGGGRGGRAEEWRAISREERDDLKEDF